MLQESELALHGGAAAVEGAPAVAPARDAAVALALVAAERDDGRAPAVVALGVDPVVLSPPDAIHLATAEHWVSMSFRPTTRN